MSQGNTSYKKSDFIDCFVFSGLIEDVESRLYIEPYPIKVSIFIDSLRLSSKHVTTLTPIAFS